MHRREHKLCHLPHAQDKTTEWADDVPRSSNSRRETRCTLPQLNASAKGGGETAFLTMLNDEQSQAPGLRGRLNSSRLAMKLGFEGPFRYASAVSLFYPHG